MEQSTFQAPPPIKLANIPVNNPIIDTLIIL